MKLLLALVCMLGQDEAAKAGPDMDQIRRRVKDPEQVWTVFRELIAAGEIGTARYLLSPAAAKLLPQEAMTLAFISYEPPRRMIASMEQHSFDAAALRARVCSKEFGVSRDFRIVKFMTIYALDLTSDDIEFLKGRPMAWYRHQVKRADGWHYAYPPDWTYAPLARKCGCGK